MHVCMIVPGFNAHGGVPYVARNLVNGLAKRSVKCTVLTDDRQGADVSPALPESVDVRTVSLPDRTFPLDILGISARAFPVLKSIESVDLYHAHGHYTVLPTIADLIGNLDAPLLITAHGTYLNEFLAFDSYPEFDGQWRYRAGVRIDHEILKRAVRRADRVHAVSEATAGEVAKLGVSSEVIDAVPNGVNLNEFDSNDIQTDVRRVSDIGDKPLAVSVGSIVPRKGVHTLVDVARLFRNFEIPGHIVHVGGVGHEGYAETVRERINDQGVENRITLTNRVDRGDLLSWLKAADVVVSASFSEGCPISLLEAAASQNTVVATDVGGARDILGDLGIYVTPGDATDIAEGIQRGFDAERGPTIRNRIEESFTWDHIVNEIEAVYKRCL